MIVCRYATTLHTEAREGALPAAVRPHYQRWLEWIGALNVRGRHYMALAMIVGLRRAQWRSAIYAMRMGVLPKDMRQDILRAGNTIPDPYQDWRNPENNEALIP